MEKKDDPQGQLNAAKAAFRAGGISVNKAAKDFGISETTLRRHLKNPSVGLKGRPTKFTTEEEVTIEMLLIGCAKMGVPLSKYHLQKVVVGLCEDKGITKPVFSATWHTAFLGRHPRVSERISMAENRKKARQWTTQVCENYIDLLVKLQTDGYLDNPHAIWNLDESGFVLGGRYGKVYAEKGVKEVSSYFDGDDRAQLTVLFCGSAAGVMVRPVILYDDVVELASRVEGTDNNFLVATNKSGWMDNATFTAYIKKEVIPAMPPGKNLICVDGHSSHINNLSFVKVCMESDRDIQILVFPAGQTGKLQPLDKSVFGGVKYNWRRHLAKLHLNTDGHEQLTRNSFPAHLNLMWPQLKLKESLISGFSKTGLFPFDPSVIRATVRPAAEESPTSVPFDNGSLFDEEEILRSSLKRCGFPDSEVDTGIRNLKRQKTAFLTGQPPIIEIVESIHKRLNHSVPEKKRKVKDVRLCTEAGKLWCTETVTAALEEKIRHSDEKAKKKRRPKQTTVEKNAAEKTAKKPRKSVV